MLANLAFHYKLDLTVLRALQHLLALLSSWFNVTLGAHRDPMTALTLVATAAVKQCHVCTVLRRSRAAGWLACHPHSQPGLRLGIKAMGRPAHLHPAVGLEGVAGV